MTDLSGLLERVRGAEDAAFQAAYNSLSGADYDEVEAAVARALDAYRTSLPSLHIVFDSYPNPDGARFIEAEDGHGRSIAVGEWRPRADGFVELVIPGISASALSLKEQTE